MLPAVRPYLDAPETERPAVALSRALLEPREADVHQLPHRVQMPRLRRVRATDEVQGRHELRIDLQRVLELDDGLVVLTLAVEGLGLLEVTLLRNGGIFRACAQGQDETARSDGGSEPGTDLHYGPNPPVASLRATFDADGERGRVYGAFRSTRSAKAWPRHRELERHGTLWHLGLPSRHRPTAAIPGFRRRPRRRRRGRSSHALR